MIFVIRIGTKYANNEGLVDEIKDSLHFKSAKEAAEYARVLFYTDADVEDHPKGLPIPGIRVESPPVIIKVRVSYDVVDIMMCSECE